MRVVDQSMKMVYCITLCGHEAKDITIAWLLRTLPIYDASSTFLILLPRDPELMKAAEGTDDRAS